MRRSTSAIVLCAAIAATAAGCGANLAEEAPSGASATSGNHTVNALCTGPRPAAQELTNATNALIEVYKNGPRAIVKYGSGASAETMQTIVVLQAQRLRRCGDPGDAARLTRVAGSELTTKH
jgi:hypothetical protein